MHPEDKKKFWNWIWRLEHFVWIKTKDGGEMRQLKLNPIQRILARYFPHWNFHLILKARQEGVSTFCLAWHLDATMFTPGTNTCILADCQENLTGLFQMIRDMYELYPDSFRLADGTVWRKPKAKYDNRNELLFSSIKSTIYVSLKVRSKTVHRLHVSEWAWILRAQKVLTATFAAVPKAGIITGETTANGMGGNFYEEWQNEFSKFMKHFFGFQDHPDYFLPVEDEEAFRKTLTPEEKAYLGRKNMKLGNIAWMRDHLSISANRKEFKQEYPSCAEEAFLTTGRSPFDREKVKDWIIRAPVSTRMEGRLSYWVPPQKGHRYVVVCDAASGRGVENLDPADAKEGGTDYTVAQVIDCETLQVCAMFRGKWPYATSHKIVHDLGKEYFWAYAVVEATDHGLTILNNLVERTDYPRHAIHSVETVDTKSKQIQKKWGFYTNLKTRPLVLDRLAEAIEDEQVRCYSQKVQSECLQFIIDDDGDMHAMEGYHDDTVMALAIGLYCVPNALRAGRMTATKAELGLTGM